MNEDENKPYSSPRPSPPSHNAWEELRIAPFLRFDTEVRRILCATNAISGPTSSRPRAWPQHGVPRAPVPPLSKVLPYLARLARADRGCLVQAPVSEVCRELGRLRSAAGAEVPVVVARGHRPHIRAAESGGAD
ncbi:hypothetical protein ACFYMW_39325 [Streptomyces sp. NPDC006692]|uniref:hypothetical protein n=1 Tax=Streptomyces sp. NPDC006692 TaxID=3364758 RepID=UPI0036A99D7C